MLKPIVENSKCKECGKNCIEVPIRHNPPASEYYCVACHKSYPMFKIVADIEGE